MDWDFVDYNAVDPVPIRFNEHMLNRELEQRGMNEPLQRPGSKSVLTE